MQVVAAPAATVSTTSAEVKASQDKVKEMAQKLGVPFTNDLLGLGSNSAISDALIEKAVAAGKSEAQINAAMASLWTWKIFTPRRIRQNDSRSYKSFKIWVLLLHIN